MIRRNEVSRPGELVQVDVKKLAKIPRGGGHRAWGRSGTPNGSMSKRGDGSTHVHSAIDASSRFAYSEFAGPEGEASCWGFMERALSFFEGHGIALDRVLSDHGTGSRSRQFANLLFERGIVHRRTRPYTSRTSGKAERFNRTLLDEWAYSRVWRSEEARAKVLEPFLHKYDHHRNHTAVGWPPITRVTNVARCNS